MAVVRTAKHRLASPRMWMDFGPHLDKLLPTVVTIATVDVVEVQRLVALPTGPDVWQDVSSEFGSPPGSTDGRIVYFQPGAAASAAVQLEGDYRVRVDVTLSDGQGWTGVNELRVDGTADA